MDGFGNFGGFGGFDFASDDFFNVQKKEPKAKAEVKESKKAEKKADEKKKASAGKGSKSVDKDVTLPVEVKGRGFSEVVEGTGTMKLSEIADKLIADGYNQLSLKKMGLTYVSEVNHVYVVDSGLVSTDMETAVDLSEEKTITVVDGQLKAEFSLADFEGKEEDEVSLKDVAERFALINADYEGCKLYYEEEAGLAYPIFDWVNGNDKLPGECTVMMCGSKEQYTDDEAESFDKLLKKLCGEGVISRITKGANTYFVSYAENNKNKAYYKNSGSVAAASVKKVERKYKLPLNLYIVTFNMRLELTSAMFDGAEKVTEEEITKVMAKQYKMFADKDRKIDYLYNEDSNMLSCMFISGKKGACDYSAIVEPEDAHTGIWKMIRTKAELELCMLKEQFLGICHLDKEDAFKLVALPHGNFLGYFGKELECCDVKRLSFVRKLPKMGRDVLSGIVEYFRSDLSVEMMVRILYNKRTGEFLTIAAQGERTKIGIEYDFSAHKALMYHPDMINVCEIHSHNTMPAFFSSVDDADEVMPGVFGVIGNLDKEVPTMKFRAGLEGIFCEIPVEELFEQ